MFWHAFDMCCRITTINIQNPRRSPEFRVIRITLNLTTPWPVERHDRIVDPIVLDITEAVGGEATARAGWRTLFPGGVRRLLK